MAGSGANGEGGELVRRERRCVLHIPAEEAPEGRRRVVASIDLLWWWWSFVSVCVVLFCGLVDWFGMRKSE